MCVCVMRPGQETVDRFCGSMSGSSSSLEVGGQSYRAVIPNKYFVFLLVAYHVQILECCIML